MFNLQRLAVLTTALGASPPDPELIYEAMKDRVHQPYRKELVDVYAVVFHYHCSYLFRFLAFQK